MPCDGRLTRRCVVPKIERLQCGAEEHDPSHFTTFQLPIELLVFADHPTSKFPLCSTVLMLQVLLVLLSHNCVICNSVMRLSDSHKDEHWREASADRLSLGSTLCFDVELFVDTNCTGLEDCITLPEP